MNNTRKSLAERHEQLCLMHSESLIFKNNDDLNDPILNPRPPLLRLPLLLLILEALPHLNFCGRVSFR